MSTKNLTKRQKQAIEAAQSGKLHLEGRGDYTSRCGNHFFHARTIGALFDRGILGFDGTSSWEKRIVVTKAYRDWAARRRREGDRE